VEEIGKGKNFHRSLSNMELRRPSKDELKLFVVFILVFTLFIHWGGVNAWSRYDLTKSIVEDQSLDISEYSYNTMDKVALREDIKEYGIESDWEPRFDDPESYGEFLGSFFRNTSAGIYTDKAPVSSFLAVPGYFIGDITADIAGSKEDVWIERELRSVAISLGDETVLKQFFIVFTVSILFAGFLSVLVYRYLQNYVDKDYALYTSLILGFSTPLAYYATSFFGVINAAFFGFAAYLALKKSRDGGNFRWVYVSGIFSVLALSTEYYAVILPAMMGLYLILERDWKSIAGLAGSMAVASAPLMLYHWLISGGLLPLPLSPAFKSPGPVNAFCSLYTACQGQFFGFVADPFRGMNALVRLLFFESRGLFFYSPVLLLSIPGVYELYRKKKNLLVLSPGIFLVLLIFQSMRTNWLAGGSFGPRYALIGLPFLALPVALGLQKILKKGRAWQLFVLLVALISVFNTAIGFNIGAPIVSGENYDERFGSFSAVQPESYDRLIENFYSHGPRSEVLMSLTDRKKGLDVTYSSPYGPDKMKIASLGSGDLLFHLQLLPLIIALAVLGIAFRDRSIVFAKLTSVIILVMFVLSFSISSTYIQGETYNSDEYRAAAIDGEISMVFHKDRGGVPYVELNTYSSDGENLNVTATVNREKVRSFNLSGEHTLYFPLNAYPGRNTLKLESDNCTVPARVTDSGDTRCLSMLVEEIGVKAAEDVGDFVLLEGWHGTGEYQEPVWMRREGIVASRVGPGLLKMKIEKTHLMQEGSVNVEVDGEKVEKHEIDSGFYFPVRKKTGWSKISLNTDDCVVPSKVTDSDDDRCLSYRLKDISGPVTKVYGEGWYPVERGEGRSWRWMSDSSKTSVFLSAPGRIDLAARPYQRVENSQLEISLNGDRVKSLEFNGTERRETSIEAEKGFSTLEFRSSEGCRVPSKAKDESSDDRCLSFMLSELSVQEGSQEMISSDYYAEIGSRMDYS
jgi:hypothetical protein